MIYNIVIAKQDTEKLIGYTDKLPQEFSYNWPLFKRPSVFIHDNAILRKVSKIKNYLVEELPVYNFSVDDDESFVTENIAVHNCKVAFDVCSICGNKARKPGDYCTHIKLEKKHIYPDGRQAFMINYNPTFFDISIVRKRADKIAYVLSKVASEDGYSRVSDKFDEALITIPESSAGPQVYELPDEDMFDMKLPEMEKAAGVSQAAEKLAMIKEIQAQAVKVLNRDVLNATPMLDTVEPDLPPYLLDALARKFSFQDILHSFLASAIPMRPTEATRIIIVQTGLPMEHYDSILESLTAGRPAGKINDVGSPHPEIIKMLRPHYLERSSFLPAVMHRMSLLTSQAKTASELKTASTLNMNVPMTTYDLDPNFNFGYVRRMPAHMNPNGDMPQGGVLVQRDNYSQIPAIMSPQAIEMERRRPKLKDPTMSAAQTAGILGATYLAYKNSDFVKGLLDSPGTAAAIAAAAAWLHNKMKAPSMEELQKHAAVGFVAKGVVPFVGAHFASAHFRNKYNNGYQLGSTERWVAENPDVLSLAAPLALNLALRKHASVGDLVPESNMDAFLEKVADFSENAKNIAGDMVQGMLLYGKRRSMLSSVLDQTIDRKLMGKLTTN